MGSWTIIFPTMLWLIVYLAIGELGLVRRGFSRTLRTISLSKFLRFVPSGISKAFGKYV